MSWRDMPGRTAYLWIYDEWIASQPRPGAVVVESGVALGKSLAYLCERLDAAGRDDVEVYAVDPWSGTHRNGEQQMWADEVGGDFTLYVQTMLRNAPRALERVRPVRLPSLDAAAWLGHRADLVVLDGSHSYEDVLDEIDCWRGGDDQWIGGDDHCADYPGVEQAVREMFGLPGDGYEYRARGGPHDDPEQYNWGTWLRRGKTP